MALDNDPEHDLPPLPLPDGVVEDYVDCTSTVGLKFHVLKCGEDKDRRKPLICLFHGFPEVAFSFRAVMRPLSEAGFYVVAPDHRGYGRTTGWDASSYHQTDLSQFSMTSIVRDYVALVHALGYSEAHAVIGHDFGAAVSAMCALMRPDLFKSCVFMSHPFKAPPVMPFDVARTSSATIPKGEDIQQTLANLPQPRKHYKWYNSTPPAANDWDHPKQGLTAFLRGYFHLKSANWKYNEPFPLKAWTATELAKMPHYYIMKLDQSMPETIASDMQGEDPDATKSWLPDQQLDIYVQEWSRTGFQGGLNFYRISTDPKNTRDVLLFAGKKIEVPSTFISGEKDWGNYQDPGVVEDLPKSCSNFKGVRYIKNAGHWVQQEQPQQTVAALLDFLSSV